MMKIRNCFDDKHKQEKSSFDHQRFESTLDATQRNRDNTCWSITWISTKRSYITFWFQQNEKDHFFVGFEGNACCWLLDSEFVNIRPPTSDWRENRSLESSWLLQTESSRDLKAFGFIERTWLRKTESYSSSIDRAWMRSFDVVRVVSGGQAPDSSRLNEKQSEICRILHSTYGWAMETTWNLSEARFDCKQFQLLQRKQDRTSARIDSSSHTR